MAVPLSQLFERLREGDRSALNEVVPVLYQELHRIAARHLHAERSGHTLQTTALVHEAYLKLFEGAERGFSSEVHFLAVASRVMRQVLVDYARARSTQKRSGGKDGLREDIQAKISVEVDNGSGPELLELIQLNSALDSLAFGALCN